jgi:hypothetical protein
MPAGVEWSPRQWRPQCTRRSSLVSGFVERRRGLRQQAATGSASRRCPGDSSMAGSFRDVAGKRASGARRFRGRPVRLSGGRPSSGRSSSASGRGDAPSSKFLGSPRSRPTPPHPDQRDPYARGRGGPGPLSFCCRVPRSCSSGRRDPAVLFGKLEPMAAAVPNLRRTVLLPNCGHWTQQERRRMATTSSWISSGRSCCSEATRLYPPDACPAHISLSRGAPSSRSAFLLVQLDLVFRTERGTPVNPNHASRAFASLARTVGLDARPYLLRHALASAMACWVRKSYVTAASCQFARSSARYCDASLPSHRSLGAVETCLPHAVSVDSSARAACSRRRRQGPPICSSDIPPVASWALTETVKL